MTERDATLFYGGIGIILVTAIIGIIVALILLIGEYKALKAFGYPNPWLAFIPIANAIALGDCCSQRNDSFQYKNTVVTNRFLKYGWLLCLAGIPISVIPIVGFIVGYVWMLYIYFKWMKRVAFFYFSRLDGGAAYGMAVLCCFIPYVLYFKLFFHDYKNKKMYCTQNDLYQGINVMSYGQPMYNNQYQQYNQGQYQQQYSQQQTYSQQPQYGQMNQGYMQQQYDQTSQNYGQQSLHGQYNGQSQQPNDQYNNFQ